MSINYKSLAALCGLVAGIILSSSLILLGVSIFLSVWAALLSGIATGAGLATYWRKSLDLESSVEASLTAPQHLAGIRRDL